MSDNCTITASTSITQAPGQVSADLDNEVVIMSVEEGAYFNMNPVASDIWSRIAEPVAFSTLLSALAEQYDAGPDVIEADVRELLATLFKDNLIALEN